MADSISSGSVETEKTYGNSSDSVSSGGDGIVGKHSIIYSINYMSRGGSGRQW